MTDSVSPGYDLIRARTGEGRKRAMAAVCGSADRGSAMTINGGRFEKWSLRLSGDSDGHQDQQRGQAAARVAIDRGERPIS
jgi:hypothetical protein